MELTAASAEGSTIQVDDHSNVSGEPESITKLRDLSPERPTPVSCQQLTTLVKMLDEAWYGPENIARVTGLSAAEVLTLIGELGTWLGTKGTGRQQAAATSTADAAPVEALIARTRAGADQLSLFAQHQDGLVIVPAGFEAKATKRELDKSIWQIVQNKPDEALLRRFLLRRYHRIHQVLTFPVVAAVHRIAQLGRLGEIDKLASNGKWVNPELARVLVEAYDLLDVARIDAVAAIDTMVALAEAPVIDRTALKGAMSRARFLAEADVVRVSRAVELEAAGTEVDAVRPALVRLAARVGDAPWSYRPADIAELNDGQVQRICAAAGLDLEAPAFQVEDSVRTWIVDAGFELEVDLLLPDGVRATQAGLGEVFQDALRRRAEEQLDWADELNEQLALVGH